MTDSQPGACECVCAGCSTANHCDRATCAQPDFNPRWEISGPGTWTLPNTDVATVGSAFLAELNLSGIASLEAATNEFIAAHIEYATAQLSCLLWSDTSIVIHEICCARRVAVAAAWLRSELERHTSTAQSDANYDDDTIIAMLGGIQG